MPVLAREKNLVAQWLLVLLLLVIVAFAPAVVAELVTGRDQPIDFLSQPWSGWGFAGTVLVSSVSAEAASPSTALSIAQKRFWPPAAGATPDSPQLTATHVELLYLPDDTSVSVASAASASELGRPTARATIDPSSPLVWQVYGRQTADDTEGVIGMLSYDTGQLIWDSRGETGKSA